MKPFVLALGTAALLAACSPMPVTTQDGAAPVTSLSGTVKGWNQGARGLDIAVDDKSTNTRVVVGRGTVAADGTLAAPLPSAEQIAPYLWSVTALNPQSGPGCSGAFAFSDTGARISVVSGISVRENGTTLGDLLPGYTVQTSADGKSLSVQSDEFLYASQPVSVQGTVSCTDVTYRYDARLVQGWNVLTFTETSTTGSTSTSLAFSWISKTSPSPAWVFQALGAGVL